MSGPCHHYLQQHGTLQHITVPVAVYRRKQLHACLLEKLVTALVDVPLARKAALGGAQSLATYTSVV